MIRKKLSLDVIDIQSPCPASWDAMAGDDRSRFCGQCKLHVYNLSDMTREAAEALVNEREGRLCVRFYRRADGTVITRDCSRVRAAMRRTKRLATATLGAVMCAVLAQFGLIKVRPTMGRIAQPAATQPNELKGEIAVMGDVAQPPPSTQPVALTGKVAVTGGISAPPSTRPATQPSTQPSDWPSLGMLPPRKSS